MSAIDNGPVFTVTAREMFDLYFDPGASDMLNNAERVACMSQSDLIAVIESYEGDLPDTVGLLPADIEAAMVRSFARGYAAMRHNIKVEWQDAQGHMILRAICNECGAKWHMPEQHKGELPVSWWGCPNHCN